MAPIGARVRNDRPGNHTVVAFCSSSFFALHKITQSRNTSISTGRMQAEKHRFALATGLVQVSGALADFGLQVAHHNGMQLDLSCSGLHTIA